MQEHFLFRMFGLDPQIGVGGHFIVLWFILNFVGFFVGVVWEKLFSQELLTSLGDLQIYTIAWMISWSLNLLIGYIYFKG